MKTDAGSLNRRKTGKSLSKSRSGNVDRMEKRFHRSVFFVLVFLFFLFPNLLSAASPGFQVVFPGNWRGKTAIVDNNNNLTPTDVWRIPDLIQGLKKKYPKTLVIGVGNNYDHRSIPSFVGEGKLEEKLAERCYCEVSCIGPGDLSKLKTWKSVEPEFFSKIWTNIEVEPGMKSFLPFKILYLREWKVGVACLISPSAFEDHPLNNLDAFSIEEPIRALNRALQEMPPVNFIFLVAYLDEKDLDGILQVIPENTRVLWLPLCDLPPEKKHYLVTKRHPRVWLVPDGEKALFSVVFEKREGGRIVETLRNLPLREADPPSNLWEFKRLASRVSKRLFSPLRIININELPRTTPYHFRASVQAEIGKQFMRSDFALLDLEDEALKDERIVNVGFVLRNVPPRCLREYVFSGSALKEILETVLRLNKFKRIGFAGGSFDFLGDRLKNFRIGGKEVDDFEAYRVTFDEKIFSERSISKILERAKRSGVCGFSLWDAWLEEIPFFDRDRPIVKK